ncbi:Pleckstrin y domain-containing H member 2 [Blastocladiella emersonii ATCC 22665]|nr:Pleckstrin y domain-containing H member 2 [Blastocladiella emersonii ATCC 22665]
MSTSSGTTMVALPSSASATSAAHAPLHPHPLHESSVLPHSPSATSHYDEDGGAAGDYEDDGEYDDEEEEDEDDYDLGLTPATTPGATTTEAGAVVAAVSAATANSATDLWQREMACERLVRSGWLEKRGDRGRKAWKRRWFVLRASRLAYYKDESEYSPLGILAIAEIHSVTAIEYSATRAHVLAIVTRKRTLYLEAPVRSELEAWLVAFDEVVRSLPPSVPSVLSLNDLAAAHHGAAAPAAAAAAAAGAPENMTADPALASSPVTGSTSLLIHTLRRMSNPTSGAAAAGGTTDSPAPVTAGVIPGDDTDDPYAGDSPVDDVESGDELGAMPHTHQPESPTRRMTLAAIATAAASTPTTTSSTAPTARISSHQQTLAPSVTDEVVRQITHRSGWLWRYERSGVMGGRLGGKHWKRRWCVLRGDRLVVYKDMREYSPLRVVDVASVLDVLTAPMSKSLEKHLPTWVAAHAAGAGASPSTPSPESPPSPPLPEPTPAGSEEPPLLFTSSAASAAAAAAAAADPTTTCFHVIATAKTHQLAAESRDDMCAWVRDLRRLMAPYHAGVVVAGAATDAADAHHPAGHAL